MRLLLLFVLTIIYGYGTPAVSASAGTNDSPSSSSNDEELRVFGALLDELGSKPGAWVMVQTQTSTFSCSPPFPNGFDLGGCSGMRGKNETPTERLQIVVRDLPNVTSDMALELIARNQTSDQIAKRIPTRVRYVMSSQISSGSKLGNPEYAAYFSRVGFSSDKTRAVVYLGTVHWTDKSRSRGRFVYLEKSKTGWRSAGDSAAWEFE